MCRRSGRPGYKEKRNAGIGVTRQLGDEADLDALCLHGLNPLMPRSVRRDIRQSEPLECLLPVAIAEVLVLDRPADADAPPVYLDTPGPEKTR
jgi:hypothetical protein